METRSHKRAEASTSSASSSPTKPSAKRSRTSCTPAPVASATAASAYSISTRSRTAALATPMDPTPEPATPSASANRGRRGKTAINNKNSDTNTNNNKPNKSIGNTNSDKGKGKESEIRNRDTGRSIGVNIKSEDADGQANLYEGGLGDLPANFSAGTSLHGLLRKLGAGLDEFLPSSAIGSSRQSETLKKILTDLTADGEEGRQVEALTQLSDMLSIGTEDSLGGFSLDSFVPVLVGLLSYESNPDIMLLAARALTHLVDVLPSACAAVVRYGAVSCFVSRLLTIEYMDLAEQSLQALKKISQEQPTPCLRAGALMAVLSYLDFFPTGVQRVALSTAEHMCKKLPSDASDFVMEAVPLLTNLLQYHDAKVKEHASICLTRIAEAFASSPGKLDELCSHGIVTQAAALISSSSSGGGQASLGTSTYTGLIRLLATCASGSALGAKSLLLLGISGILKDLLLGPGLVQSTSMSPALGRPPEQIFEIVNLANELLPPFPQGTISLPASSSLFVERSIPEKGHVGSSGHPEDPDDSDGNVQKFSTRQKLLNEQPGLLQKFGMDLLPVLVQIYGSSVNGPVRHKCLSVIGKLMYFSSSEMIQSLINVTNISSFLAGVLAWKDPQVLVPALQIGEILMDKLPHTFSKTFVREGVVHAVDALILTEGGSTSQPSSENIVNDSIPGSSLRSRRNRRRGVGSSSVANVVDESKTSAARKISPLHSVETPFVNSSLRVAVSAHAKVFKEKYFPSDAEAIGAGLTDDLLHFKNLCTRLNMGIDDQKRKSKGKSKAPGTRLSNIYADKEEQLVDVIAEVLREISREDGASTFEFMGSGVVASLLNYFTCGYFSKERISESDLARLRPQAIRRYKSFVSLALPSNGEGSAVPMSILLQKLQNALSSLERFPLALTHTSGSQGGTSRISSGLSALSHPIKLRLSRARGEKNLVDFSSNVVLVDPLASLTAIEDFLLPRVQRIESNQEPSPHAGNSGSRTDPAGTGMSLSTRSRSSGIMSETTRKSALQEKSCSSSKAKGKAVVKPTQEDAKGPWTRSAARKIPALDKDKLVKPGYGDTSSEEEELGILPGEIDEGFVIGDDYISDDDYSEDDDDMDDVLKDSAFPISMPDIVHDIKLGDSAEDTLVPAPSEGQNKQTGSSSNRSTSGRGSDSNELRSSSRGALSFAAAAMAGLASGNNIGLSGAHSPRSNDPPKLIFTLGGRQVNGQMTVYQAIQSQLVSAVGDDDRFAGSDLVLKDGNRLWTDIHTILYQRADIHPERSSKASASSLEYASLLDSIMKGALPCDLDKNNPTYNILALLRLLEGLNQLAPRLRTQAATDSFAEGKVSNLDEVNNTTDARVSPNEFVNSKLTPKLAQQIQNTFALCTGSLPSWCYQLTKSCPFLFPFEIRHQYFYSTAFGFSRALNWIQQQGANGHGSMSEREVRVGRLPRLKVRVSRNEILDSAVKVMEMSSSETAVLEVEYFDEVGTGLGPTLEFYTLLSHNLQRSGLGMWRSSSSETVHMPLGLFPRPWAFSADTADGSHFSKVVEYFRLLGRVMAKALQDGRLLDLPLSAAFYKLVLGQELDLYDIISFDAELGSTLQEFRALVCRKKYLETVRRCNPEELRFRGTSIEDLCLDFSLPGYPEYILKPGEENVDMSTLGDYVALVVDATVGFGIIRQMDAFRSGFNEVFDISTLQIFSPSELDHLLCGRRELWKAESLADHIKFDHGYTSKSPAIIYLLEIMGEFTPDQQRAFCQFVTGAPCLPPGGLAVLNPKLTVVRKLSSSASNSAQNSSGSSECADDDLPSVMTCANYLKLPPYSSKEIMYKKLVYAISEGQGSFDLS